MKTYTDFNIENIENYLMEVEEAEECLKLVANLCREKESLEFIDPKILKYIGDFIALYLDRSASARHYFLKLDLGNRKKEYGIAGEIRKLEIKHSLLI